MPSYFRGSDNFDTTGGNAVKAWVNFNGTGTVAIRASGNVSSITDNGVGDYTVNFTNAMADANYSAVMGFEKFDFGAQAMIPFARLAGSLRVQTWYANTSTTGAQVDASDANLAVFR